MTDNFSYYNRNPNQTEEEDCVTRAISLALKIPYPATANLLSLVADHHGCPKLCLWCYEKLLTDVFNLPIRYCNQGETVGEISSLYPNNTIIIRIEGHLTCSIDGIIYDLFDCTDRTVDCYWIAN